MATADIWLREEFKGREEELETREDYEARTGTSVQSLSSMFTRYADRVPGIVKMFGKTKFFVAEELDDFAKWIEENAGTRSNADVRRSELARVRKAIALAVKRVEDRQRDLDKANRELAKFRRQEKGLESDIAYLEQVE